MGKKGKKHKKGKGKGQGKGQGQGQDQGQEAEGPLLPAGSADWPCLELVEEVELARLLGDELEGRGEASGVHHLDGWLYVVFDDVPHVARLSRALKKARKGEHGLIRQRGGGGFEDLTFDPEGRRWFLLMESAARGGAFRPRVEEYSEDFRFLGASWLDWEVEDENKGLEGLAHLRVSGKEYLLGMCEGNHGKGGRRGREPGFGRVQLFARAGKRGWEHVNQLELPRSVLFEDYASLDVSGGRITVVSQATSAVWIGELKGLKDPARFASDGQVYRLPVEKDGRPRYGSVEGITWVGERELAAVSDRHDTGARGLEKAIHVFRLPPSA